MQQVPFKNCTWLNQPKLWSADDNSLEVTTDANTDFWRKTHYGFERDSGHFLGTTVSGDVTAEIRFRAHYDHLYDQAGLMIRVDDTHWVKAGIEFTDGEAMLSTVVTRGHSDWSVGKLTGDAGDVRLRVTLAKGALRVQASANGTFWPLFRLAPFPVTGDYRIGPMCCSPERGGFTCRFSDFTIGPATSKDLHDLT